MMRLKVLTPNQTLVDAEVVKIVAEAEDGAFGLLPHHIDFATALTPGLLAYETPAGQESFLAVDEGTLVKQGPQVLVSTRNAVHGPDLGSLRQTVIRQFRAIDEYEKQARSTLAKLEADFVRRFIELEGSDHA